MYNLFGWKATALSVGVNIVASLRSNSLAHPTYDVDYSELQQGLSSSASIYLPGYDPFGAAVVRWSNLSTPTINVVVVPGTDSDVSVVVNFANKHHIPFLATSGMHGSINTLGRMDHGIEIRLNQLDGVDISTDGKTARIGGGIQSKSLIDKLWTARKQTVTGTCECVGYLGPGLGGGHGWLQGHYGLVSDQFISFDIVLANGSFVTVDEKSDLFWGLKGAGHNFGIITSVKAKIYDLTYPNYAIDTMVFSGDYVKQIYQLANELWVVNGTMPDGLNNWSYWYYDPTIDSEKPVIAMYIIEEGVNVVNATHTKPFLDL
ncbi:hypothetical protein JX266_014105, partial [Neoarthrinium moseri]